MNESIINKIKLLREKTGASFLLCKEALNNNSNNLDYAIDYIRKKENILIINKSLRKTQAGFIYMLIDEIKKNGVLLEINCETDFVAKSKDFLYYVDQIAKTFLCDIDYKFNFYKNFNDIKDDKKIQQFIDILILKFKENIYLNRVRRFLSDNILYGYTHTVQNINKICSILVTDSNSLNYQDLAYDIAMHITAMKPNYLSIDTIPNNDIEKEKNIYYYKINEKYNDKNIFVKNQIVENLLKNFYNEKVLLEQLFIKDNNKNIKSIIENKFNIIDFERFEIGDII